MIATACQHEDRKIHGRTKAGTIRYKCKQCGATFTASTQLLDGMRIGIDRAVQIIHHLVESTSIRATSRLMDTDEETILDLLVLIGERCKSFLERTIHQVAVDDIQIDEIWSYVFCKQKTAERLGYVGGFGDAYCFTAIERNTKLVVAWHFGKRDETNTEVFAEKLRDATRGRFHLSSDGFTPYRTAIPFALAGRIDYGQIVKIYGEAPKDEAIKYSPAKIKGIKRESIWGKPNWDQICTSHTERANGTMRNFIRRMNRLTYCFSKKWDNHEAALALYFTFYNFCRVHGSLEGQTPAMANGLASHPWAICKLLENTAENGRHT